MEITSPLQTEIFPPKHEAECTFTGNPQQLAPNYPSNCLSSQAGIYFTLSNNTIFCPSFTDTVESFEWITGIINSINTPRAGARILFTNGNEEDHLF